jgi:hypothetical protein
MHIRPGGLNMASGVQPDVLVGLRASVRFLEAKLL